MTCLFMDVFLHDLLTESSWNNSKIPYSKHKHCSLFRGFSKHIDNWGHQSWQLLMPSPRPWMLLTTRVAEDLTSYSKLDLRLGLRNYSLCWDQRSTLSEVAGVRQVDHSWPCRSLKGRVGDTVAPLILAGSSWNWSLKKPRQWFTGPLPFKITLLNWNP